MQVPEKAKKTLETAVKVAAYAALGSAGSALAWIAVSSLLINHRRRLKPAIADAELARYSGVAGEIAYYRDRRGDGRPMVFLHSVNAAASAIEVKPLFEHFRGDRPVFAPDLPGFGYSVRADRRYSPELFARAIADFVENEVGPSLAKQGLSRTQPVDLVALSLTSEFAAQAVQASPQLFSSLTMISPTGFSEHVIPYSDFRRKSLSVPLWSQAFFDLLTTRASIHHYLGKTFGRGRIPQDLVDYAFDTSHQNGARYAPLYFLGGHLFTPEVREHVYNALKIPVRVVYDRDGYVTFDALAEFVFSHPNWTSIRIPGTNGMPQWEKPAETFAELDHALGAVNT